MPITNETNYIKVTYEVGDLKGDTKLNPWTLQDVYDADVAGVWGYVVKNGNVYSFTSKGLHISTNSFFETNGEIISIIGTPLDNNVYMDFLTNEVNLNDTIIHYNNNKYLLLYGNVIANNCTFYGYYYFYAGNTIAGDPTTFIDCKIHGFRWLYNTNFTFYQNVTIYGMNLGFAVNGQITSNGIRILDCVNAIYTYLLTDNITFNNLTLSNNVVDIYWRFNRDGHTFNFIDCKIDPYKYSNIAIEEGSQQAYLKSTFKWLITGGADIQIRDKDNNIVLSKTINYDDSDIITYNHIMASYSVPSGFNINIIEFNPFSILVSKTGYQSILLENINIIPGEETLIILTLASPVYAEPPQVYIQDVEPTTIAIIENETE